MFISEISIENYRLFSADTPFVIKAFNVPDGNTEGSGINVFVGENGCGKTALLEALSLPILEYKSDSFSIEDMNDPQKDVRILVFADKGFSVQGTMPNNNYSAKGFQFKAGVRSRATKAYLSSIVVTDQLFIKSDPDKPKDGSPDLRVSVNNPFSGKRFSENDVVFLDKNRCYQTKTGSYNQTRFDRLMEDFDYQYTKGSTDIADINAAFSSEVKKVKVSNDFLTEAINEFRDITGIYVKLELVDNYHPYRYAAFALKKDNKQQIKLGSMGSGYEMIFSLVYSYHMARQSGKQLIVLIDEPELHLHPALQEQLIVFILKISKDSQIFISTHSSLLILEMAEIPVLYADDLSEEQVKAYRLADNKTAEFSEWDAELLVKELDGLKELEFDMEPFGFEPAYEVTEDEAFDVDDIPNEPVTKPGDIYHLGNHRLMCGDSTSMDDVQTLMDGCKARLVFTDPP
ncbi:MAG: AAA family ATPase, partial [Christensenellales bacterium]